MPWSEVSTVMLRQEFVTLAERPDANIRALCRRFGVSPETGYSWLRRYRQAGLTGLSDRSRRPAHSPRRTSQAIEQAVLELRAAHPAWGGRKLAAVLRARGQPAPHPATITAILRRHGQLGAPGSRTQHHWQRFEQAAPNQLWQMDFKGHFPLGATGQRCHPLTVLDDHSRYSLGIVACANERGATVQACLIRIFRRAGLPDRMLMDNGSPWGNDGEHRWTPLGVWLLRLGIGVVHGRPYHPQTQGKDERFHRTLLAEAIAGQVFGDLASAQRAFDAFRTTYNHVRPHEACGLVPPIERYQVSKRSFPETLPPIEYDAGATVRMVQEGGQIHWQGRTYRIPAAFRGLPVAIRPSDEEAQWQVYFLRHPIATLDRLEDIGAIL
ncbi:MAG TPA: IS481 family transposase [Aquabacterium sp.]|nr:IS481 family transposase [Aquabacterium sp.]